MIEITFPTLLRDRLIEKGMTPSQLAKEIGSTKSAVVKWLKAQNAPKPFSVLKISKVLGGDQLELFESALRWYHDRGWNYRFLQSPDFVLKDAMEGILHSPARGFGVPEESVPEILELWKKAESFKARNIAESELPFSSDLIVLPKPTIHLLNNWSDVISTIAKDSSQLYNLDWKKFEDLIAHLLEHFGWQIEPMGYTKDEGIDLIAVKVVQPDIRYNMMVQCKKYSVDRKVGVQLVRDVWSVKWDKAFHNAMIATTSFFTRGAQKKAELWNLELRDFETIVSWCKEYGKLVA